jgi:hypothetical protein
MNLATQTAPVSRTSLWTGRILSALSVLFLLFDGVTKVMKVTPVLEAQVHLGIPASLAVGIGTLELICIAVYVIPRTAILGAILLTGYLGGATAMLVRIGDPFYFPIIVGVFIWGGLFLADDRLRTLIIPGNARRT